ncbi:alpha/beta fold hydrolase [Streptomyces bambusae]|uniref:Alpha/beta fold hydrolase n=1 Tax=Streptomyces bambusae TaxID=1550616 RepID=A0ABS6Z8Z7_9ACTN|nr:alpha/beta hydrolase [Streptomyces bambusae]MBW5483708.1 alpha/beta fold hydrolase [Streptomyces bambusae]
MTRPPRPVEPPESVRAPYEGFVRAAGVPLHVVVEGSGPVCVLSAGLAMAWFDWDPVVPLLAPYRTVVRFDRPGHGLSAPADRPPTAAGEAHRIASLLDALGATGPVTVVGHSIAGFHTEAFARLYPERTAALVLVDPSVEEAVPRTLLPPRLRTAAARALGGALAAGGLPASLGPWARRAAVRVSRTGGPDPAPRPLTHRCYRTGRVWRGALLENARYPDMAAEVLALRGTHPLTVPATVLTGYAGPDRGPALTWLGRQAALADRLGAWFEVAEGAGHLVMLDRPHQVARAVLSAGGPAAGCAGGPAGGSAGGPGEESEGDQLPA